MTSSTPTTPSTSWRRIREKYLSNTTVTIVLTGECTKARKYVDWEIASSLRNDPVNGRSGLLGINMKSVGGRRLAPIRLYDNYDSKDKAGSYALYQTYPSTAQVLRNAIQMAFDRRETHTSVNTRALFQEQPTMPMNGDENIKGYFPPEFAPPPQPPLLLQGNLPLKSL